MYETSHYIKAFIFDLNNELSKVELSRNIDWSISQCSAIVTRTTKLWSIRLVKMVVILQ